MSDNSSYLFFNYFNKKYNNGYYLYTNDKTDKVIKINTLKHILYFLNSKVCVNAYDIERYMSFEGYGKKGLLETFGDILNYKKSFYSTAFSTMILATILIKIKYISI